MAAGLGSAFVWAMLDLADAIRSHGAPPPPPPVAGDGAGLVSDEFAWKPTPEYVEHANVTRLMRAHGIDSIDEMRRRSVEDVEWYWDAVVKDLGLDFTTPYEQVLDISGGVPWAKWFTGGRVNITWNCVDRWAHDKAVADRPALIGESETGEVRDAHLQGAAQGRRPRGGRPAARWEWARATPSACSCRCGPRRWSPPTRSRRSARSTCRSSPASRPRRSPPGSTTRRPRRSSPPTAPGAAASTALMKPTADEAVAEVPSVERVVVLEGLGVDVPMNEPAAT